MPHAHTTADWTCHAVLHTATQLAEVAEAPIGP